MKLKLEEHEAVSAKTNERVAKLTNELAEFTERLEELNESFQSKESGAQDTSPLVRIKAALQQLKQEMFEFDMRIGVVSHSLLSAKVTSTARRRIGAAHSAKKRNVKNRKGRSFQDDNSGLSGEDDN